MSKLAYVFFGIGALLLLVMAVNIPSAFSMINNFGGDGFVPNPTLVPAVTITLAAVASIGVVCILYGMRLRSRERKQVQS